MFNVGSVQGYLKLNTSGWSGPMKGAENSLNSLTRTFTRTGAVFLSFMGITEREFGKFDKAIRHATSVTLTLTEEQFAEMSTMALDSSVKWNKAAADTAQAFYFLGSAGLTATEQMQAFNDTIMLSRAMGADLSTTVEGMVDIVRAFGLEFKDVTNIADQLTYTITSSNQMFQDLDKALSYASSTARLTNNTLAETNAMLGIMANAGIKGCYDDQTEVLTRRGWLPWNSVVAGDAFATVNPNTGFIEYQKPTRLIRYHHKGKMYHVANRGVDLCVTPGHRMWVKMRDHEDYFIKTAEEVDGKNVRYKAGGMHWRGFDPEYIELKGFKQNRGNWKKNIPTIKINAEEWVTFLGWYISEGSCDYRKGCYRVRITQNQGSIRDKMREVLNKLPVTVNEDKNGFIINNEQIWRAVEFLGKAPQKYIPNYALDWSPRLLNILLDALMEGDGDCNECYYTSSKRLADQVMEIALKLGVSATAVIKTEAGTISNYDKEGREIKAQHDQWKVSIKREQLEPAYYPSEYNGVHRDRLDGSKFPHCSEWIDYDGEVFCAEVPNHLLIVRRNGKPIVSGNSMAGTVLRRAMTNLMSPTAGMNALMHELGLKIYDATGQMAPFIDVIGEIDKRLQGTSDAYRNMVFEVLFGRRAIAGMITLFNYGAPALRRYANEIKNAGGTTQKVADKQMKAFTEVLGQLFREVQRLAIEFGELLAPTIERISKIIKNSVTGLREYVKANKEALTVTLKWVSALSLLSLAIPVILAVISSVVGLVTPFTVVVATLYLLRTVWVDTFKKGGVLNKSLDDFGKALSSWADENFGLLDELLRALFYIGMATQKGFSEIWKLSGELADIVFPVSREGIATFTDVLETGTKAAAEVVKMAGEQIKEDAKNIKEYLMDILPAGFTENINKLTNLIKSFLSPISDAVNEGDEFLTTYTRMNTVVKDLESTFGDTVDVVTQWSSAVSEYFQIGEQGVAQWADTFMSAMSRVESSWADTMETVINEGGNMKDFLDDMFKGILRSFNRMIAEIAAADLMYAIAGGGETRTAGVPSLVRLFIPSFGGVSETSTIDAITRADPGIPTQDLGGVGKMAGGNTQINITNNGNPVNLRERGRRFDGKQWVVSMIMEELSNNPVLAKAIRGD